MSVIMTYQDFKKNNDTSKAMGVQRARIVSTDFKTNTCIMDCMGNKTKVDIQNLIEDIVHNGMGCLTNPSALQNWSGWSKDNLSGKIFVGREATDKIRRLPSGMPLLINMIGEWKHIIFIGIKDIQSTESYLFFDNSALTGTFALSESYIRRNTDKIKFKFDGYDPGQVASLTNALKQRGAMVK